MYCLCWGHRVRVVADRGIDPIPVVRRAPLDAAGIRAGTDEPAPEVLTGGRVERPVHAALLSDADDVARPAFTRTLKTFAPAPAKSQTLNRFGGPVAVAAGGHHVTDEGWLPHASCQASSPAPRKAHRIAPVRRSKATTELKCAPAGMQASLQPPGAAVRHAVTLAGCV